MGTHTVGSVKPIRKSTIDEAKIAFQLLCLPWQMIKPLPF
jgi:hypothetical protein